jgi:hypothetical protein
VLVPADRFHGWTQEIDKELSKLVEDGISITEREIHLFSVKLLNGQVAFTIMGKEMGVGQDVEVRKAE